MIADVAVLFVDPLGEYPKRFAHTWDERRDARTYKGKLSVIAHPPCSRWCQLAGLVQARWGHRVGDDGHCFAAALAIVKRVGGVIEHPAYSKAWDYFGIPRPARGEGWLQVGPRSWTCYVEQHAYGHPARKATYLFYVGERPHELRWQMFEGKAPALMSWSSNRLGPGRETRPRIAKRHASATPPAFAAELLKLARRSKKKKELRGAA